MERSTLGLIAAVAGLSAIGAAPSEASTADVVNQAMQASSFSQLLDPIPNAAAILKAADEADGSARAIPNVELAQYHHHHHVFWRHRHHHHHHYHHHHHHHHYNGY
jgi:hypothetical protein